MLYFSYGSFMDFDTLKKHCPSAVRIGNADLLNFEMTFNYYSNNYKGGCAGVDFVPGKIAYGVLYEIPEEEMLYLDTIEGVPTAKYYRQQVCVVDKEGKQYLAWAYRTTNPTGPFLPSRVYLKKILDGAIANNIKQEFVEELTKLFDSLP